MYDEPVRGGLIDEWFIVPLLSVIIVLLGATAYLWLTTPYQEIVNEFEAMPTSIFITTNIVFLIFAVHISYELGKRIKRRLRND